MSEALQAWQSMCRKLERLGEATLTDECATADPTEMLAHLADQVVCWVGWYVFHADPARPFFHRQNDLVTQWGGPNGDNVYRHARIDPSRRYRIRGRMHSCEEFLLAIRVGFMHEPVHGTVQNRTASDLGIGPGDEFELLLGGDDGIPIPDGAVMVTIREYYFDWQSAEPAVMVIECLDDVGPAAPLRDDELASRIDDAARGIELSFTYWNRYLEDVIAARDPNRFAESHKGAKGVDIAQYAFCIWDLEPGQALLVDTDAPSARMWSLHLYNLGAFEHVDLVDRVTTLNHRQAVVDHDGRVRAVVSAEDPGVANWLDTGGRRRGLLTIRWFWPVGETAPPAPRTRVVPVAEARDAFGYEGLAAPPDRDAVMRARRTHLGWRFRV